MRHRPQNVRAKAETTTADQAFAEREQPGAARAPRAASNDYTAFLLEFLRYPQQIGSVVPSSRFLERRLVEATDAARARVIVELGPGTGGTTRALLRAMRADAQLLAVDLSPAFCARLKSAVRDPRLTVQHGSAEHIETFLRLAHLPRPDTIVSGIPFSTMPPAIADRIAHVIASTLAPGGRFVAYQLRAHVAGYATPYLGLPEKRWEWRNLPPMRVFRWQRAPS